MATASFSPRRVPLRNPLILLSLLLFCAGRLAAAERSEEQNLKIVNKYLAAQHPGKNWEQGPTRIQSGVVDKAFADAKFYYVFSSQDPQPRAEWISLLMRLDKDGGVSEVSGAGAMNVGLMKVSSDADAKIAAAAIMSLTFGPFGPVAVSGADVQVAHQNGGWYCLATPGPAGQRKVDAIEVSFDASGACTELSHRYTGGR